MSFFDQPRIPTPRPPSHFDPGGTGTREVPAGLVTAAVIGGTLAVTGLNDVNPAAARLGLNNQTVVVTGMASGVLMFQF